MIEQQKKLKPTGGKNYGKIGHLPESRLGDGDHHITEGQARICLEKKRDKHDRIIVQEKLDGSNVGVAKVDGKLWPIQRAGYLAASSPHEQHHLFDQMVRDNEAQFNALLREGERACGEWLMQAHGTRYFLPHDPFVLFDIMKGTERITYDELRSRALGLGFTLPYTICTGEPIGLAEAFYEIGAHGRHGAIDPMEGLVYRVERNELIDKKAGGDREWKVDFLAKYVCQDKEDGQYLPGVTGSEPIWNGFTSEIYRAA